MRNKLLLMISVLTLMTLAQENKVSWAIYDGIFIGGYVGSGAFLNFTGPNINATYKNLKFMAGMLPSLRFKEDNGIPKNSFVTPNLGIGFTCSYKMWAVQIPIYYDAKSATRNGYWQVGLGAGIRLSALHKKHN